MVVEHRQAPVVLRRQALELLHPDAARRRHGGQARGALQGLAATRSGPCSRRSSARPQLYDGPAHGQAADRPRSPGCCAPAGAAITDEHWSWVVLGRRAAPLLPAGRRGLGRQALARHEHHARALAGGRHYALDGDTEDPQLGARPTRPRPPRPRSPRRARSGATPPDRRRRRRAAGLRAPRDPVRRRAVAARAAPERAAPADRRLPRLPDELRSPWPATATTTPTRPGRSRPARHRARHADARRHRPQPARRSSPARAGSRCRSSAARCCRGSRSRRASRPRAGSRLDRVLVSIFLSGGLDSLSVLAPVGDPRYASLRPEPRAAAERRRRRRLHRGRPAALAPERRAAARPAPRRARSP